MVRCLQLCVTKFSEWEEESNEEREIPAVIEEAQEILQSLIERMGKSDPEDFELDKSSDFSATSSVGQKNRTVAKMMMGVYEVNVYGTCTVTCITVPSRKRAHGWCTLHWARLGDGPIFEVSVLHLDAKERPGRLPTLSS